MLGQVLDNDFGFFFLFKLHDFIDLDINSDNWSSIENK